MQCAVHFFVFHEPARLVIFDIVPFAYFPSELPFTEFHWLDADVFSKRLLPDQKRFLVIDLPLLYCIFSPLHF